MTCFLWTAFDLLVFAGDSVVFRNVIQPFTSDVVSAGVTRPDGTLCC